MLELVPISLKEANARRQGRQTDTNRAYGLAGRGNAQRGRKRGKRMKYRYYSTQRPVSAGTYPKPKDNPAMLIHNFNEQKYVAEIGRLA